MLCLPTLGLSARLKIEGKASRRGVAVAENLSLNVLVVSAQVVVVDAGANDFNSGSAEPGWAAAYRSFLLQVTHSATLHPCYAMNIVNKLRLLPRRLLPITLEELNLHPMLAWEEDWPPAGLLISGVSEVIWIGSAGRFG